MVEGENGRGGACFMIEGECDGARENINEKTGEASQVMNVKYWGGEQFIRLERAEQASKCRRGTWLKVRCELRKFRDQVYPGRGVVVEVDHKPVVKG